MTKQITINGVGTLSFPDQATDEQIAQFVNSVPVDQLRKMAEQQSPRTLGQDLMRQMGLAARAAGPIAGGAAIGGALGGPPGAAVGALGVGLGQMVGDPLVNLYNLATKSNVPTPSASIEGLLTRAGLPEPETPSERIAQEMVKAGTTAGGMARGATSMAETLAASARQQGSAPGTTPAVLSQLGNYPAQQVAAASTAGMAGGALREGGAGPGMQMGGAMMAGMIAPGGPKLPITQRLINAPSTLVQPFTEQGRQVMIGDLLKRLATNPEQAMSNLQAGGPLVPGVRPSTAALARDPGLAAAETAIRSLDQQGAFPAQISSNQQAILDAYRKISGRPGSIPLAEAKRTSITAPMREEAFSGVSVDPEVFKSGIALVVNKTIDNIKSSPVGVRMDVENAMQWATQRIAKANNPMELYEIRKDLAAAAQGKYNVDNPSLRLAKGQLTDVIKSVDDVIDAAAPGYAKYMSTYRKSSSAIDQMRLLQDVETAATRGAPNLFTSVSGEATPIISAAKLRNAMANKKDELGIDISPAANTKLNNIMQELERGQIGSAPGVKVPGSDTFKNMSMGNLIGRIFSESLANNTTLRTMTRPLDFLYKLPDQKLTQLLVESMLDPQLASMMMAKSNIMRVEPLARSLRMKAEQLGFGADIGAAEFQ